MRYKTVHPEMGYYYYTREGRAAYVAYAFMDGKPLPLKKYQPGPYALALGFVFGITATQEWSLQGQHANVYSSPKDLVERISMECAFQYPHRRLRPKPKPAHSQGMLL